MAGMRKSIITNVLKALFRTFPLGFIFTLGIPCGASLWSATAISRLAPQSDPVANQSGTSVSTANGSSAQETKNNLSNFAWLAGDWQGTWGPRIVEQTWMAPKAGQMTGIYQVLENTKTLVVELFSLLETPDGIEFRFRHFTPELTPWEKDGPTSMELASLDSKTAVFENSAAGQPKRALFIRVDPNTYISRSEIVAEDGTVQVTEITFRRQPPATSSTAAKKGPKAK
jgi:hypothetical protein